MDKQIDPHRLYNEQEAAQFLGFTPRALQCWRYENRWPVFVKVSARAIRYRRKDLINWIEKRLSKKNK